MRAAEELTSVASSTSSMAWAEICTRHPNEWVCLLDVVIADDGSILSGRTLGHARSMRELLASIQVPPSTVVLHTHGRPVRLPRIEMTDEIRDIVRARR